MKSRTIVLYSERNKRDKLTPEEIELADTIYEWAEANYENGGDTIVECMTPTEIVADFHSLDNAIQFCRIRKERQEEIESEERMETDIADRQSSEKYGF